MLITSANYPNFFDFAAATMFRGESKMQRSTLHKLFPPLTTCYSSVDFSIVIVDTFFLSSVLKWRESLALRHNTGNIEDPGVATSVEEGCQ
jgi:hypothetical protein